MFNKSKKFLIVLNVLVILANIIVAVWRASQGRWSLVAICLFGALFSTAVLVRYGRAVARPKTTVTQ
jgi:hypothetical protein